ncbi:MAG TPA: TetR family transcriptional regulator [Candidatus Chromulinivoraceae bacterium]|nr:TetR family transcriptional regulator [Candidatus Chromulinivoraceae bacterium]
MSESRHAMKIRVGLREQKRRHLLDTVHKKAVVLSIKHGYDLVTVEQIAVAAMISRSTFFRHFATKEAAVLYNSLGPDLMSSFRNQSSNITTIQALRNTFNEVFSGSTISAVESKLHRQRMILIRTVPKLRMAMIDQISMSTDMLASLIAEHAKRTADDPAVRTLASALMGVTIGILIDSEDNDESYLDRIDEALKQLETGFLI